MISSLIVVDRSLFSSTWFLLTEKSLIVEQGNFHKFTNSKNDPEMVKKLLDTGDRELVEVRRFGRFQIFKRDNIVLITPPGLAL